MSCWLKLVRWLIWIFVSFKFAIHAVDCFNTIFPDTILLANLNWISNKSCITYCFNLFGIKWLWVWFLHCSTLLRPEMCLFPTAGRTVRCMHHELAFVLLCIPALFADNARCQFVLVWYGFPQAVQAFRPCFLWSVYSGFLYCFWFVILCCR